MLFPGQLRCLCAMAPSCLGCDPVRFRCGFETCCAFGAPVLSTLFRWEIKASFSQFLSMKWVPGTSSALVILIYCACAHLQMHVYTHVHTQTHVCRYTLTKTDTCIPGYTRHKYTVIHRHSHTQMQTQHPRTRILIYTLS